ncbi:MAG TPA: hypothetical protein VIM64_03815, partial [Puia sp.]
DPGNMRLLYQMTPPADTMPQSNYLIPYECKFPPTTVKYIKVMVEPIGKQPPSLLPPPPKKDEKSAQLSRTSPKKKEKVQPANDRGWFFVDELFVN